MKLLLDTHVWLWYSLGDFKLSLRLRSAIADTGNELWLSPITLWEAIAC
jgi:PIN domain nuclease of toxin-antitoxin system